VSKEEKFDLNFAAVRPVLNMINDGLIIKVPSERLDVIARLIVQEVFLLMAGKSDD
jgi:hypothetical protein